MSFYRFSSPCCFIDFLHGPCFLCDSRVSPCSFDDFIVIREDVGSWEKEGGSGREGEERGESGWERGIRRGGSSLRGEMEKGLEDSRVVLGGGEGDAGGTKR